MTKINDTMKHFYSLLVTLSLSIIGSAQAPQGFNYQAVIRDGGGEIIANDLVSVRFILHQADANGPAIYQETHTPTTNEFGLVNLVIGQGLVNSGVFADINWSSELHFLQVEVNPGGGFVDLGTQQLMSVPYALSSMETVHAWGTSGNAGTDTTLNFIGTTDNVPLVFKINNEKAGLIDGNFQDIYLGYQAGNSQSIQYQGYEGSNVGIGCQALYSLDFGWGNVGVGKGALFTQDGGAWNVAIGAYAGNLNQNGHDNCVIGAASLHDNTIGNNNTAVGRSALGGNVAGSGGTAVGAYAMLYANSTSSEFNNRNVAVGFEALRGSNTSADNTGNYNTATGYQSMFNNSTGSENTFVGYASGYSNTTADNNSFFGSNAGYANTTGTLNTFVGTSSGNDNTTGSENTFVGVSAGINNTTASQNVFIGRSAGRLNTTGTWNTFVGYEAGYNNSTADYNTGSGYYALRDNTVGFSNTAFGYAALFNNTTGNYNTAVGRSAYFDGTTLDNTTCLGRSAGGIVDASNRVEIGNTSVSVIAGQVSWSTYSDARIKDNVQEDVPGLAFITKLRPVTYNLNIHRQNDMVYANSEKNEGDWQGKYDIENIKMTGFLAQEVEQAAKESGYDFSGVQVPENPDDLYSLRYSDFVMPLVKSVQELSEENKVLKTELNEIRAALQLLQEQIENSSLTKPLHGQ